MIFAGFSRGGLGKCILVYFPKARVRFLEPEVNFVGTKVYFLKSRVNTLITKVCLLKIWVNIFNIKSSVFKLCVRWGPKAKLFET